MVIENQMNSKHLACSTIRRFHGLTAHVDSWRFTSTTPSNITGLFELTQDTEFDATKVQIKLKGLQSKAKLYRLHSVSL